MYDWNEKMVVYQKKQWGDVDGKHHRLFLHTKIHRIPHDETRAGEQEEENESMWVCNAVQKNENR
jgi:hypothetical protein